MCVIFCRSPKSRELSGRGALAALGAFVVRRPVKLVLDRMADMRMTGKRHPYSSDFKIGFDDNLKLVAYEATFYQNAGAAADSGVTGDDVQAIMIGIAPVVGTAKVVASAGNIFRALGFAIMAAEAEIAEANAGR